MSCSKSIAESMTSVSSSKCDNLVKIDQNSSLLAKLVHCKQSRNCLLPNTNKIIKNKYKSSAIVNQ